jgi:peptidyl-prolyl cis-trans isomerase C
MRKTLLASALLAALSTTAVFAAGPSVNGTEISQARIDAVVQMMAPRVSLPTTRPRTWSRIS